MNRKVSRNRDWGSTLPLLCLQTSASTPLVPYTGVLQKPQECFSLPETFKKARVSPVSAPRGGDTFAVSYNLEEYRMTFLPKDVPSQVRRHQSRRFSGLCPDQSLTPAPILSLNPSQPPVTVGTCTHLYHPHVSVSPT